MKEQIIKYAQYMVYWSIVLIPFSISIAPPFTYTCMGFLTLGFLVKKILKREKLFVSTPVNLPLILLFIISLISFKNSVDYHASVIGMRKLFINVFILMICAQEIKDKKHVAAIAFAVVCGGVLASFDAVWQVAFGKDFIRGHAPILNIGLKRATAAFPDSNVLGIYLSAIVPLIAGLALFYFKGRAKIVMLSAGFLVLAGVFLTFARGTALAVFLSILFICICRKNKIIPLIILCILLISPFVMPKGIKDWARQVNYNPVRFMLNDDRISIYRNAVNMIRHHPFIGVGVNTFSKNYIKYKLPEPENAMTADSLYAHNHFLHMAGEIGLTGLGIFLWFLVRVFRKGARILKNTTDDYTRVVAISLIACLIAFLVNGLTETSLYYARVAMIFWYLAGFLFALDKENYAP